MIKQNDLQRELIQGKYFGFIQVESIKEEIIQPLLSCLRITHQFIYSPIEGSRA